MKLANFKRYHAFVLTGCFIIICFSLKLLSIWIPMKISLKIPLKLFNAGNAGQNAELVQNNATMDCKALQVQSLYYLKEIKWKPTYITTPHGISTPTNCSSYVKLAIIVPYRNREEQLGQFIQHMKMFLQCQFAEFQIIIVEQSDNLPFNRGALMNIGVKESMKINGFDCLILHDVDHLPLDIRLIYQCFEKGPRHFAVAVSQFNYVLPYDNFYGGVVAITSNHFRKINGFSNCYWGWGAEDDDFGARIEFKNLSISRPSTLLGRYHMLTHAKRIPNSKRYKILVNSTDRMNYDGLENLEYETIEVLPKSTYLLIQVKLSNESDIYCK